MAEVFGRKYSIKIGRNTELIAKLKPEPDFGPYPQVREDDANLFDIMTDYTYHKLGTAEAYSQGIFVSDFYNFGYNDISVVPPKSITIDDIQIEIKIVDTKNTKNNSKQGSTARLYNLNKNTRDFIRVGDAFIVRAGFEQDGDELPLLYVGQIETVRTLPRMGNDIVTELYLTPTQLLNDIKINRSYPPDTSVGDVITDLVEIAASKGLPTGKFFKSDAYLSILNRNYPFGIRVNGKLLDALQEVCSNNNYRSYVVLGKLYVHPVGYADYRKTITLTTEDIKGTIEVEEDGTGTTSSKAGSDTGRGLKVTIPLNANIDTTTIVKVNTESVKGSYTVESVEHELVYENSDTYDTKLSLKEIK